MLTRRKALSGLGSAATFSVAGCMGGGSSATSLRMMTSTESTAAYQMSQGIAAVINENSDTLEIDARPSDGANQSMTLLDKGNCDIAYFNTLGAFQIQRGEGNFSDYSTDIAQLFHYYLVNNQLVSVDKSTAETVNDLSGKRVSPAPQGQAARDVLLAHMGVAVDTDDVTLRSVALDQQASQMSSGTIQVGGHASVNGSITPSYMEELYSSVDGAWLLEWPEEVRSEIESRDDLSGTLYTRDQLGPGGYGDRDEVWFADNPYQTFVRKDMDEEIADELLRVMWENVEALGEYHAMAEFWQDKNFFGNVNQSLPVHPAAKNFFAEIGAEGF